MSDLRSSSTVERTPAKPPGLTWLEHLRMLLNVASEIEHALMVQYLYAAYSLGGDQVPPEHRARVAQWRREILTIAREEMGHLLCVQNAVRLIGGPVWLQRSNFPWDSPYYPFEFRFEPFTMESLSCYVYAEMPKVISQDTRAKSRYREFEIEKKRRIVAAVQKRQESSATKAHPVGELYRLILELVGDETRIPDSAFHGETLDLQGSFDDWGRNCRPGEKELDPAGNEILQPAPLFGSGEFPRASDRPGRVIAVRMATRTQVLAALSEIAGQGEAPNLEIAGWRREPSHFDRFLEIYEDFERAGVRPGGWTPARPVPRNPTTQSPTYTANPATHSPACTANQGVFIENDRSRRWGNLFNVRYRMLLMYLAHAFQSPPGPLGQPDLRGMVIHRVFGEMYNLKTIAGLLVEMPLLRNEKDPRRAGPPFEMPYSIQLPAADVDAWRLHRELLASSDDLTRWMLEEKETPFCERFLNVLRDGDRRAGQWIDGILTGLAACGGRTR